MSASEVSSDPDIKVVWKTIVDGVTKVDPRARLTRSWIFQESVAVFDYSISGYDFAFDVKRNGDKGLRIEVFGRKGRVDALLQVAGFDALGGGRFLIADLDSDNGQIASGVVTRAVDQLVSSVRSLRDKSLLDCLGLVSPLAIVDVGANNLSDPPYTSLYEAGLCTIVGFEPQQLAYEELIGKDEARKTYYPFAIGAAGEVVLNVYAASGFTSVFKVDEKTIGLIPRWYAGTRLKESVSVSCRSLDDALESIKVDLLKIDIQGGELEVFRHARKFLSSAICIITEVSFFPLYSGAPTFADVHNELLGQGFYLHRFLHQTHIAVGSSRGESAPSSVGSSQIIDGDAVYLRDYRETSRLASSVLRKYCLIAHYVTNSKDLAIRMLSELRERGDLPNEALQSYVKAVS